MLADPRGARARLALANLNYAEAEQDRFSCSGLDDFLDLVHFGSGGSPEAACADVNRTSDLVKILLCARQGVKVPPRKKEDNEKRKLVPMMLG